MSTINPNCKCINKSCKNHGNCKACREYHKSQSYLNQTYCQAGAVKFITKGLISKLKLHS